MSDFIDSLVQSRKNGDYMYHQGRADERERIANELKQSIENGIIVIGYNAEKLFEIVRGGE